MFHWHCLYLSLVKLHNGLQGLGLGLGLHFIGEEIEAWVKEGGPGHTAGSDKLECELFSILNSSTHLPREGKGIYLIAGLVK